MSKSIKVGITHGDINGVGYEILLKTFSDNRLLELFTPVIYGSAKAASYHRKVLDYKPVPMNIIASADNSREGQVNFVNCVEEEVKIELGTPSSAAGDAAFKALECAVRDLDAAKIDLLVTLPIHKDSIQNEQFKFPGHTEYLQDRLGKEGEKALMILASDMLRVALLTTHIPIAKVAGSITKEGILSKLKTLNRALLRDFNIENPRIAVLGLNPHAGENGLLGREETDLIIPAIQEAQKLEILCSGPFAADGFFGTGRHKDFDAVLAMYHDQGLIPFKSIAMDSGVNFTAGLSVVRTSPDHGTAYDIAGQNLASEESFRQAIYMATDIFKNRLTYDEARKNPLRKLFIERGKDDEKLDLTKEE
ncbi:MAG: 4-hydroxythreonine-4-phosphate dehydrogenase PdxA [Dysgonamonadaceae bacterium]|jgi:4-hydroxythreonine-4-phosphate dehydrogenase|nr:4-hydroxythreonine-4-phosphate dehydrogenase PdxA [Dysgonamonadaceae bacterium]